MQADINYINYIYKKFMEVVFSEIGMDEDFPIITGFTNNSKKNSIKLYILYNSSNIFMEYKLGEIKYNLEQIGSRFDIKLEELENIKEEIKSYDFTISRIPNIENRLN